MKQEKEVQATLRMREGEAALECGLNGKMYVLKRGVGLTMPQPLYDVLLEAGEIEGDEG